MRGTHLGRHFEGNALAVHDSEFQFVSGNATHKGIYFRGEIMPRPNRNHGKNVPYLAMTSSNKHLNEKVISCLCIYKCFMFNYLRYCVCKTSCKRIHFWAGGIALARMM